MEEYIPRAPLTDEDKKANKDLPGMGGVYNPVKYVDPDGRDNNVAIVGGDSRWGYRKTFYEAAVKSGYRVIAPGIKITIPGIGNYGATTLVQTQLHY